jgi:hypothetical protein
VTVQSLRVPESVRATDQINFLNEVVRRLNLLTTSPNVTPRGNTLATAIALGLEYTEAVNVTSSLNAFVLPPATQGLARTLTNNSTGTVQVYPAPGETINGLDTPYAVGPGLTVTFRAPGRRWFV